MSDMPRRERFFQDIRGAVAETHRPAIVTSGAQLLSGRAVESFVQQSHAWLNPGLLLAYDSTDFENLSREELGELAESVNDFRTLADTVHLQSGPTYSQSKEGLAKLESLGELVKRIVVKEWQDAARWLINEIQSVCVDRKLPHRYIEKKITESLLGEYAIPQFMFRSKQPVEVVPLARFVVGACGLYDMAVGMGGYVASLFRDYDLTWQIHIDVGGGVEKGRTLKFDKEAFISTLNELEELSDA